MHSIIKNPDVIFLDAAIELAQGNLYKPIKVIVFPFNKPENYISKYLTNETSLKDCLRTAAGVYHMRPEKISKFFFWNKLNYIIDHVIFIDVKLFNKFDLSSYYVVLLHELGHFIDFCSCNRYKFYTHWTEANAEFRGVEKRL